MMTHAALPVVEVAAVEQTTATVTLTVDCVQMFVGAQNAKTKQWR